ncbi:Golgi phosphoprotein 3 GPP34 [Murinocardiopsis flavida]|uniref:Golgi phosphoprotein 3 GPP34 n=1 Tax=Murinocardiopsis flavida TaxID=645275 RepID=A0A2P8DMY6_9ACTN|nr:GPP34 family phosphoprotein [Murinocardiopsis flavida]PSK98559.1 Golgi phosphoprotein 3 GPP34 [Murinocardiopsis flavida]
MPKTTIAEELLLLCYDPGTGRPLVDSTRLTCGLVGAMVADLALAGRLGIDAERLYPLDGAPMGDPQLDGFAARVAAEPRPRKIKWWVTKVQNARLRKALLGGAVAHGVLTHQARRALGIFPMNDYRPAQPGQRDDLVLRLGSVLRQEHPADSRSVALLALCGAVRVDRKLFRELPQGERRRMIKAVMAGDEIGRAVKSVIQSIEAATAAAASAGSAGAAGS